MYEESISLKLGRKGKRFYTWTPGLTLQYNYALAYNFYKLQNDAVHYEMGISIFVV